MVYYADGWCEGKNPSDIGGGYTVVDEHGDIVVNERVHKVGFTNNEAELLACVAALEVARDGDTVIIDSQNTLKWITNIHRALKKDSRKRKDLDSLKLKGFKLLYEKNINLVWDVRDVNLAGKYNEVNFKA